MKAGFAGERPEHHMKKTPVEHPKVKIAGGTTVPRRGPSPLLDHAGQRLDEA